MYLVYLEILAIQLGPISPPPTRPLPPSTPVGDLGINIKTVYSLRRPPPRAGGTFCDYKNIYIVWHITYMYVVDGFQGKCVSKN